MPDRRASSLCEIPADRRARRRDREAFTGPNDNKDAIGDAELSPGSRSAPHESCRHLSRRTDSRSAIRRPERGRRDQDEDADLDSRRDLEGPVGLPAEHAVVAGVGLTIPVRVLIDLSLRSRGRRIVDLDGNRVLLVSWDEHDAPTRSVAGSPQWLHGIAKRCRGIGLGYTTRSAGLRHCWCRRECCHQRQKDCCCSYCVISDLHDP